MTKAFSHERSPDGKDEWLTPPSIIESLGLFDLDPCAPTIRPWPTARSHYTIEDNGLERNWFGRVWCNPPYGNKARLWLSKLSTHGNGIAFVFARTETKMFFESVWDTANALLFLRGRVKFHHVDGSRAKHSSGAPSVLIAYGDGNAERMQKSGIDGAFVHLRKSNIQVF